MRAHPGDWIVIKSRTTGRSEQRGLITEVRSADGSPPYVVSWPADDHVSVFFPGSDAVVLTAGEMAAADKRERARFAVVQQAITRRSPREESRR
jgi:hypothetical protein